MFIHWDAERPSDSPFVERVWRCHREATVTLHGPETQPREVHCPPIGEWFAIRFKAGRFMPQLPVWRLLNGNDVSLPPAFRGCFKLDGSNWQIPNFDNAEVFVQRLVRRGLITRDAAVAAALDGNESALTRRGARRSCCVPAWRRSKPQPRPATSTRHTSRARCAG